MKEMTKEMYVIEELNNNNSCIPKDEVIEIAKKCDIEFKPREAKTKIINKILDSGNYDKLFDKFKDLIYVPIWKVADFYGLNSDQIENLREIEVIKEQPTEDHWYSRRDRKYIAFNKYPLSILDYDKEEIEKIYKLSFGKEGNKIRLETTGKEEVDQLINDMKKVFTIKYEPVTYAHRNGKGFYTYFTIEALNNTEYETNMFLATIEKLKQEIKDIKEKNKIESEKISSRTCEALGIKDLFELRSFAKEYKKLKEENKRLNEELKALKG